MQLFLTKRYFVLSYMRPDAENLKIFRDLFFQATKTEKFSLLLHPSKNVQNHYPGFLSLGDKFTIVIWLIFWWNGKKFWN